MKHPAQYAHLCIYRTAVQKATVNRHLFSQKVMDIALSAVSFAGLISAIAFLAAIV